MSKGKISFTQLFLVGSVFLVGGLVLKWYPESVIGGLTQRSLDPGLSQLEKIDYQDSVRRWEYMQITAFFPLSSTLMVIGIIIMIYSAIYALSRRERSPETLAEKPGLAVQK